MRYKTISPVSAERLTSPTQRVGETHSYGSIYYSTFTYTQFIPLHAAPRTSALFIAPVATRRRASRSVCVCGETHLSRHFRSVGLLAAAGVLQWWRWICVPIWTHEKRKRTRALARVSRKIILLHYNLVGEGEIGHITIL